MEIMRETADCKMIIITMVDKIETMAVDVAANGTIDEDMVAKDRVAKDMVAEEITAAEIMAKAVAVKVVVVETADIIPIIQNKNV